MIKRRVEERKDVKCNKNRFKIITKYYFKMNDSCGYQGPWYECLGPTAEEVRLDLLTNFTWFDLKNFPDCFENTNVIKDIIYLVVGEGTNHDFGTHRGYATFKRRELYVEIDEKLKEYMIQKFREKYAWKKLRTHLLPLIIHKLYKPDGLRFKICEVEFNKLSINKLI